MSSHFLHEEPTGQGSVTRAGTAESVPPAPGCGQSGPASGAEQAWCLASQLQHTGLLQQPSVSTSGEGRTEEGGPRSPRPGPLIPHQQERWVLRAVPPKRPTAVFPNLTAHLESLGDFFKEAAFWLVPQTFLNQNNLE